MRIYSTTYSVYVKIISMPQRHIHSISVSRHDVPLIGHCTDSASNSLSGLMQQASPDTYPGLDKTLYFIGLSNPGFDCMLQYFVLHIHLLLILAGIIPVDL